MILGRFNNYMQCAEFIKELSGVECRKQTEKMLKSPKLAFAIDESTDVSHTSEMIIYVQWVDVDNAFSIELDYFAMVECPGGSAAQIFTTVCTAVKARDRVLFDKWVAFATDGPSVMVGCNNSVVQRLKAIKPYIVDVHCVGHREPLAAKDAFDSVAHCAKLDEVIHGCGSFFSHSTERRKELRDIAVSNNDDTTQVDMACNTRWLSNSMAADSIVEKYESVVEQHFANRNSTLTSEGLYRKLTDWNIMGGLLNVCDVLDKLKRMSLTFQKMQLDGHTVQKAVNDLIRAMERYEENDDHCFGKELNAVTQAIPGYTDDTPHDFTYGGGTGGADGGFVISFTKSKRDFIRAFCKKLAKATIVRVKDRFPMLDISVAFDIYDRRRFPSAAADAVRKGDAADDTELKVTHNYLPSYFCDPTLTTRLCCGCGARCTYRS